MSNNAMNKTAEAEVEAWYHKWMADRGKSGPAVTVNILDMLKDFAASPTPATVQGESDAIEFADWVVKNDYIPEWPSNENKGKWHDRELTQYTTTELYQLFKQSSPNLTNLSQQGEQC